LSAKNPTSIIPESRNPRDAEKRARKEIRARQRSEMRVIAQHPAAIQHPCIICARAAARFTSSGLSSRVIARDLRSPARRCILAFFRITSGLPRVSDPRRK